MSRGEMGPGGGLIVDTCTAEPASRDPDEGEHAASLLIPDPQFPRGWYRYWVKRQQPPGAARPMGFRQ